MQTAWPGETRTDVSAASAYAAALLGTAGDDEDGLRTPPFHRDADRISTPWYARSPLGGGLTNAFATITGGTLLSGVLARIAAALGGLTSAAAEGARERGPQIAAADLDIASVGDPHLSETGRLAGGARIDKHFESMTGHDDLVHARDVAGGYRVSTATTTPAANGVTWNREASVHANGGADRISMRNDGTFTISNGGTPLALTAGQSATLAGGETVRDNEDGSLTVSAGDGNGGTIATTLRAAGNGVDVTTHIHALHAGGDVIGA